MKIRRKDLLEALKAVKPGIDTKERVDQSDMFVFTGKGVYAYNDEIALFYPFETDFTCALPAQQLFGLLSKMKDDEIDIEFVREDEDIANLVVSGKNFKAEIFAEEVLLPFVTAETDKWYKLPDDFADAIKTASLAVSKNLAVPILACIHFRGNIIESCDNFRLLQWKLDGNFRGLNASAFGDTLAKLVDYDINEMAVSENWLHFRNSETGFEASVKRFLADYPDLEELKNSLDMSNLITIKFPSQLKETLDRADLFAEADEVGNKTVTIIVDKSHITVKTKCFRGKFEETVAKRNKIKEPFAFTVRLNLFRDILKLTETAEVDANNVNFIKFETDKVYHLVLLEVQ